MLNKTQTLIFVVVTLIFSLTTLHAEEIDFFDCSHFEDNKQEDCEYILDQDLEEDDQLAILQALYKQSYEYDNWNPDDIEVNPDLLLKADKIDYSRIFTAWKIFILGLFNYFVFSFLTKYSVITKWLTAAC